MHLITPNRLRVINPLTGDLMPSEGVKVDYVLPAFHALERTGAVSIAPVTIAPAKAAKKDAPNAD